MEQLADGEGWDLKKFLRCTTGISQMVQREHNNAVCMFPLLLDGSSWYWSSLRFHQLQSWNLSCGGIYLVWLVLDKVLSPHSFVPNAQQQVQLPKMGLFSAVVCTNVLLLRPSCAARPPQHCPDKAFPELDEPRKKTPKPKPSSRNQCQLQIPHFKVLLLVKLAIRKPLPERVL